MSVGWSVGRIESLIHSKSLIVDDFANTCEHLTRDPCVCFFAYMILCVFLEVLLKSVYHWWLLLCWSSSTFKGMDVCFSPNEAVNEIMVTELSSYKLQKASWMCQKGYVQNTSAMPYNDLKIRRACFYVFIFFGFMDILGVHKVTKASVMQLSWCHNEEKIIPLKFFNENCIM